jgi:hypothetical protein
MKEKFFIQHSTIIYHPISPILKAFKQFVYLCLWLFWDFPVCAKIFLFLRGETKTFPLRVAPYCTVTELTGLLQLADDAIA